MSCTAIKPTPAKGNHKEIVSEREARYTSNYPYYLAFLFEGFLVFSQYFTLLLMILCITCSARTMEAESTHPSSPQPRNVITHNLFELEGILAEDGFVCRALDFDTVISDIMCLELEGEDALCRLHILNSIIDSLSLTKNISRKSLSLLIKFAANYGPDDEIGTIRLKMRILSELLIKYGANLPLSSTYHNATILRLIKCMMNLELRGRCYHQLYFIAKYYLENNNQSRPIVCALLTHIKELKHQPYAFETDAVHEDLLIGLLSRKFATLEHETGTHQQPTEPH